MIDIQACHDLCSTAAPTWTAPTTRRGSSGVPRQCHTWGRFSGFSWGCAPCQRGAGTSTTHVLQKSRGPNFFFWTRPTVHSHVPMLPPTLRSQHGRHHGRCHNGSTWHLSGYDLSETCKKATDIYAILAANLEHPCHSLHSIDYAPQLLVTRWPYDPE